MSAPGDSLNASTGTEGLDYVLNGGLPKERIVLVWGEPGCGKTTLGLQFLLEGARRKERVLYLPLTQTRPELNEVLTSHGWSAKGLTIVEQPENIREGSNKLLVFFFRECLIKLLTQSRNHSANFEGS